MIELFEYRHKYLVLKNKVPILSVRVPLEDEKLYTEETYTSERRNRLIESDTDCLSGNENKGSITITFAYTPGGNDNILVVYYR